MKGCLLFLVVIALFSPTLCSAAEDLNGERVQEMNAIPTVELLPKLVVEEVRMDVPDKALSQSFDLDYVVDPSNATFTLTSSNYAIDKLGFRLISQKKGALTPRIKTVSRKKIILDLSQEPKGTYYLRLCQNNGDIIKIYRLIKAQ